MRGARVLAFWLAGCLFASGAWPQVRSLSADLRYETQWTRYGFQDGTEATASRSLWGLFLEGRGFVYHPRFLAVEARGFLEGERRRGDPALPNLRFRRRSPYDLRLTFFAYRPVSLTLRAFRQTDTSESPAPYFRTDRVEQTTSAGASLRWSRLPHMEVAYAHSRFTFETWGVARQEVRLRSWTAMLQKDWRQSRWEFRAARFDYDTPGWVDTLRVEGAWSRLRGNPLRVQAGFQTWGAMDAYWVDFYRLADDRRLYARARWTEAPGFRWLDGAGRYEASLSRRLRLTVEPSVSEQAFRDVRYRVGSIGTGLAWETRWKGWGLALIPRISVSYHTGDGQQGWGYGGGFTGIVQRSVLQGQFRWELGGNYDLRPILPRYTTWSVQTGASWEKDVGGAFRVFVFARRRWQETAAVDSTVAWDFQNAGLHLKWPRLRIQAWAELSDMAWHRVTYSRRLLGFSVGPIRVGPVVGEMTHQRETVNGRPYDLTRGDLRWRVGRFQFMAVSTYYRTSGPTRRDWWDVRFWVQRPIPLIGGAERPSVFR